MNRPYILCHMVTSLDGKVTGDFLSRPECEQATEAYYEMNREYKAQGSGGFICGRVTMEGSFTGGWYPDLTKYEPMKGDGAHYNDFWSDTQSGYYAIAFDPKGKLGWKEAFIDDYDPGYDKSQIIEVLTEQVDPRYLTYLQDKNISYFFAGKTEIDVSIALEILHDRLSPNFYVLEGGSIINGYFLSADCVDEISLVQAPIIADKDSKPLFMNGSLNGFELTETKANNGAFVMRYKRTKE